mgnify:CR=1 FL=1
MGFVVLHMEKVHGSDSGTTAHIERFIIPKNADPTRTHLTAGHRIPRRSERPFGGCSEKTGRSGADTQNRKQPSTGNPNQRVGNA